MLRLTTPFKSPLRLPKTNKPIDRRACTTVERQEPVQLMGSDICSSRNSNGNSHHPASTTPISISIPISIPTFMYTIFIIFFLLFFLPSSSLVIFFNLTLHQQVPRKTGSVSRKKSTKH